MALWDISEDNQKAKSMAVGIMSLFDHCYVKGVQDACNVHDEMMCMEFIEATNTPGQFGFLWKERDARFDLKTWNVTRFISEIVGLSLRESIRNRKALMDYIKKILTPTQYHFCLLHVAQEYYKRGIVDYLKHPNANKLYSILQSPTNMKWTLDGAKKMNQEEANQRFSEACFDRMQRCEEAREIDPKNKYASKQVTFENFMKSVWAAKNGNAEYRQNERRGRPRK